MATGFLHRFKKFAKNVRVHAKRAVARDETLAEAVGAVWGDLRRLLRSAKGNAKQDRKQSLKFIRLGRDQYNVKNYSQAEQSFRQAVLNDPENAIAYTYLGYSLYKEGRTKEAAVYWEKAIETDPQSDAAAKARRKLQHLTHQKEDMLKKFDESTWFD